MRGVGVRVRDALVWCCWILVSLCCLFQGFEFSSYGDTVCAPGVDMKECSMSVDAVAPVTLVCATCSRVC